MKSELFNKLYSNLVHDIKKEFSSFNVNINEEKKDDEFIVDYMNWRRRFISRYKRKVYYSREIKENPKYKNYKKSIEKIAYKFKSGDDLTPFLSKGIVDTPYKKNSRKDKDIFLNAFGIHHFHLGNVITSKKYGINFVKRHDDLLYALIKDDKVYFIDIDIHNFGNLNLFRIMKDNWEYLLSKYELRGILPSKKKMTDEMVDILIHKGANVTIELDNKVYGLGFVVSSGHTGSWMFDFNSFINQLEKIVYMLIFNDTILKNQINKMYNNRYNNIDFKLVVKAGYIYLVEESSQSTIIINWAESSCEIFEDYCKQGKHVMDLNY
ncbi:hypothetical protein [Arcobacter sp.]|uniref:hypothetical protein n=1 Tax=unclassified Arcobacter TaxID=2593671 RepID=UPI003B00C762